MTLSENLPIRQGDRQGPADEWVGRSSCSDDAGPEVLAGSRLRAQDDDSASQSFGRDQQDAAVHCSTQPSSNLLLAFGELTNKKIIINENN